MNFLQVNITFYDAVNIMHHVIITRNPYPYTDKFVFLDVTFDKDQQIRCWRIYRICKCTYCCRISKISNSVWKTDDCLAKARQIINSPNFVRYF